jgi:hypothetical protein
MDMKKQFEEEPEEELDKIRVTSFGVGFVSGILRRQLVGIASPQLFLVVIIGMVV